MFCFLGFHKFGKIIDNYRYCEKCGKVIPAPAKPCEHKWKIIQQGNNYRGSIINE